LTLLAGHYGGHVLFKLKKFIQRGKRCSMDSFFRFSQLWIFKNSEKAFLKISLECFQVIKYYVCQSQLELKRMKKTNYIFLCFTISDQ
jgi:hypothetical protein